MRQDTRGLSGELKEPRIDQPNTTEGKKIGSAGEDNLFSKSERERLQKSAVSTKEKTLRK